MQKNTNKHGILFLENRSNKLTIGKNNTNDVLKIVGVPHTKSIKDKMTWIYFERILTKGRFIKLGQNVVKENNVLVLTFNKFGILENKNFFNKERIGRNPKTRKEYIISARKTVKFTPSQKIIKNLNKYYE